MSFNSLAVVECKADSEAVNLTAFIPSKAETSKRHVYRTTVALSRLQAKLI